MKKWFLSLLLLAATSYVAAYHVASDDCTSLARMPEQFARLHDAWQEGRVTAIVRHASDCDPQLPGCTNGDETLTPLGERQARQVGEGFERSLGGSYQVSHSRLQRTTQTAKLAFGYSEENPNVTKPCKDSFQDYVESIDGEGNRILVTHSSCFNSLRDQTGSRLLGFSASKDSHFAIAAFFERQRSGKDELLGCVWPEDWAAIPSGELQYYGVVAQKVSIYLEEWL